MSLGSLLECTIPRFLSETAASGCQRRVYDALMNGCQGQRVCYFIDFVLHLCLGAVCAPEAQKDFSTTLQIQHPCTAPITASSAMTQRVIT